MRLWRGIVTALAAACLAGAWPAHADPVNVSRAETLLFITPHLDAVPAPSRLHYEFRRSGSLEKAFQDSIDIDITAAPGGGKKGSARFLSGSRRVPYPDVEDASGNPLLLFYLEHEIREMARLTGGSPDHFRRRIRMALAESAQIKDVEVRFGGRKTSAQQISIAPYAEDPNRDHFTRLAAKRYTFTVGEGFPGYIYRIEALVPASGPRPALDDTVTLESVGTVP